MAPHVVREQGPARLETAFNVPVIDFSHLVLIRTHTSRQYNSGLSNTNIDIDQHGYVGFVFFGKWSGVSFDVAWFPALCADFLGKASAIRSPGQPILI